jgi:hypothetical protein
MGETELACLREQRACDLDGVFVLELQGQIRN